MSNSTPFTYSISSLSLLIEDDVKRNPRFNNIYVLGEISNLTKHFSGHWYFSLKDEKSVIKAVMFKSSNRLVNFNVNNGDQVIVNASLSYYGGNGSLQLLVHSIKPYGLGVLLAKYEALKQKYQLKGYFDESIKKTLPKYPMTIGLIVGANSAAQADCHTTLASRWPLATLKEINTLVQGSDAPAQIIDALHQLDQQCDVIVLARGGGSIEDLWAFNDERLIETIHQLHTPLISGVGHESDTTLVDFVADYRANTPTGAMQKATPNIVEVIALVNQLHQQLLHHGSSRITNAAQWINYYKQQLTPTLMQRYVDNAYLRLDQYSQKLGLIKHTMDQHQQHILFLKHQLLSSIQSLYSKNATQFSSLTKQLHVSSPLQILAKGYTISTVNDQWIKSIDQVSIDDTLVTQLNDGTITSKIISIKENSNG